MNLSTDKILHIQTCALISLIVALIANALGSPIIASIFCGYVCALSAGFGKEFGDKFSPSNRWSWKDVLADVIGGGLGVALAALIILVF